MVILMNHTRPKNCKNCFMSQGCRHYLHKDREKTPHELCPLYNKSISKLIRESVTFLASVSSGIKKEALIYIKDNLE